MSETDWSKGMPLDKKIIFDEAGIYVYQYNNNIEDRIYLDISGSYDNESLKELKQKINSLHVTEQEKSKT